MGARFFHSATVLCQASNFFCKGRLAIISFSRCNAYFTSLSTGTEQRMRAYLDARPRERHGRHDYEFADTGLDLAETRARFADYQAQYAVASEL